jgi:hypothetical protein
MVRLHGFQMRPSLKRDMYGAFLIEGSLCCAKCKTECLNHTICYACWLKWLDSKTYELYDSIIEPNIIETEIQAKLYQMWIDGEVI